MTFTVTFGLLIHLSHCQCVMIFIWFRNKIELNKLLKEAPFFADSIQYICLSIYLVQHFTISLNHLVMVPNASLLGSVLDRIMSPQIHWCGMVDANCLISENYSSADEKIHITNLFRRIDFYSNSVSSWKALLNQHSAFFFYLLYGSSKLLF